jgi:hypothetical protein
MTHELNHYHPLKIKVDDVYDLSLLSAYLQDALAPITSMHFDEQTHTFTCLLNRFCWELVDHYEHHQTYYRVHTGVTFKNVQSVCKRNFHQSHPERTLNLLTFSFSQDENGLSIRLLFSGDREIDLSVSQTLCLVHDFHVPWPTSKKPVHIHEHIEELSQKSA